MGKRIIFATGNENKVREAREILGELGLEIISQKEAGLFADVCEDGTTFKDNALIKARGIGELCEDIVIADDSGLVVDYLGGEPGIYSSRYMGEDTSYEIKNREIIRRLEGAKEEERTARFVCAIAAVLPDGRELISQECVEGVIAHEPYGDGGFGYDPIFMVPEYGKTTAELDMEEKNKISHRGKALRAMCALLKEAGL
ncbi:MAG: XTP/dITP diphosphatase [Lachnospiraceae bacterium]|nr:XTP/dITP diphosphatase [Lachnospiraceae bacterium]